MEEDIEETSGSKWRLTTYETLETEGIHAEFDDLSSKLQIHTMVMHDEIINETNSLDVVAHSLGQGPEVVVMFSGGIPGAILIPVLR